MGEVEKINHGITHAGSKVQQYIIRWEAPNIVFDNFQCLVIQVGASGIISRSAYQLKVVITHLNSFQKIFEKQLNSTEEQELEKNSDAPQQEQNSSSETILKPIEITRPKKNKTTDEEYQQSLESFLFLKDKKKSE